MDVIRRLVFAARNARAEFNRPRIVAKQLSLDQNYINERKYSNASEIIPKKFYLRILFLLFYSLVYSIYCNITIVMSLNGSSTGKLNQDIYAVDNVDYIAAIDGVVLFLIFGTSEEAKRSFWTPILLGLNGLPRYFKASRSIRRRSSVHDMEALELFEAYGCDATTPVQRLSVPSFVDVEKAHYLHAKSPPRPDLHINTQLK